ncbi:hypothetical protein ABNC92_10835 [Paenibacillus larvae]|uniref:Uncharacterized protein n=1 Tax=Paenibacillus phage Tripp TaxID=1718161 RepID=A0A0N9RRC2_9CAUD|nr:hypothetical protein [Paenibacillus larvae]YP_009210560.1 hypothetical protein TRIPP_40 [Paenibacillus phage Tripp]ALH46413.1 hypothetical protein TRIPP_40 [Paenibacillus phage Tripp]ETK28030.1 hypothetical protein ERIC1_1c14850 [Paenibacillus larvae subsp. larvae DSM 25719]MDT2294003.1 hypothetical protein [Paenibacillus larvae]
MNQSERLELQKSYLAALARQRESCYPELARQRNLDLILHTEAVSQIEAIVDLPSMRKKQKLNEIKKILLALRQKQELDGRDTE